MSGTILTSLLNSLTLRFQRRLEVTVIFEEDVLDILPIF